MASYNRNIPSGPRGWQPDEAETYRRRSPPRYGPPASHAPPEQRQAFGQRPAMPPLAPRSMENSTQRPSLPPQTPRNAFGMTQSPRKADPGSFLPRQPRHDDSYRQQPYNEGPDYDRREPPLKRFRPASYEPPRVSADTYRPHTDGPIERQPYRMPESRNAYPPQGIPYESRRPPYQPTDRYPPHMGDSRQADARPYYKMPRYPGPPRPYEAQHAAQFSLHDRSRTTSGGSQWQQPSSPRMPPSPRQMYAGWHPGANAVPHYPEANGPRPYAPAAPPMQPHPDRERHFEAPEARYENQPADDPREQIRDYEIDARRASESGSPPSQHTHEEARSFDLPYSPHSQPQSPPIEADAVAQADSEADQDLGTASPPSRSPTPPFVPQDFDVVLRSLADNAQTQGILAQLSATPQTTAYPLPVKKKSVKDLIDLDSHEADLWIHRHLRSELEKGFRSAAKQRGEHIERLYTEYRDRNDQWKRHCERLDKLQAAEAAALAAAQARAEPLYTPTLPPLSARSSSRRGTGFFGDAVRSEAEFQELLASLEAEEMTDPNLRATRTAATVPDMLLPNDPERRLAMFDLDSTLVTDPVTFFQLEPGREVEQWTQDEQSIFCKRFALHPKIFGKIAAGLPGRSTAECVRFYYHNKYRINFRSLLDKRAKRRNRGIRKGASSLLSNLVSNKGDDLEEEPQETLTSTPDLSFASTVPIRDRHHSVGDSRPGLSRLSTSQKKAARFAAPLEDAMDPEETIPAGRSRVKSMPAMSTSFGSADESKQGLLPPLSLTSSAGKTNGPNLGYFDTSKSASGTQQPGLQHPSPRRGREDAQLDALLESRQVGLDDQDTDEEMTVDVN